MRRDRQAGEGFKMAMAGINGARNYVTAMWLRHARVR